MIIIIYYLKLLAKLPLVENKVYNLGNLCEHDLAFCLFVCGWLD